MKRGHIKNIMKSKTIRKINDASISNHCCLPVRQSNWWYVGLGFQGGGQGFGAGHMVGCPLDSRFYFTLFL